MATPTDPIDIVPDTIPVQKWDEVISNNEPISAVGTGISPNKPFQSANFISGANGWRINTNGDAEFNAGTFRGTFSIGGTVITVDNTQDIQTYLNTINTAGGGTLYLKAGIYTLASSLTMYPGVALIGTSPSGTVIDFNSTAGEIVIAGTTRYSTGTITSITYGVNVVGSGTSWLANVVAGRDHLFINGQWMIIAQVTDDTNIVLAEGYDGSTIGAGTSYRISTPITNIKLEGFNIKNSTGAGINIDDARYLVIENVYSQDNNIGLDGAYMTELSMNGFIPVSNTSHGITITNGGRYNWNSVNSVVNGGSGIVLNGVRSMGFSQGVSSSNTGDGFNITGCTDVSLTTYDTSANGGQGIECVSGNNSLTFFDGGVRGNASDGLKLTATTDNCFISGGSYEYNGGYGINIAASTCDNNIVNSSSFNNNSSGNINNLGTNTFLTSDTTVVAISSTNLRTSDDTEVLVDSVDYEKYKEIQYLDESGVVEVYLDTGSGTGAWGISFYVYVNGSQVGVIKNNNNGSSSYIADNNQSITVNKGDLVQIYAKYTFGYSTTSYIKNFRLKYDKTFSYKSNLVIL